MFLILATPAGTTPTESFWKDVEQRRDTPIIVAIDIYMYLDTRQLRIFNKGYGQTQPFFSLC